MVNSYCHVHTYAYNSVYNISAVAQAEDEQNCFVRAIHVLWASSLPGAVTYPCVARVFSIVCFCQLCLCNGHPLDRSFYA